MHFVDGMVFGLGFGVTYFAMELYFPKILKYAIKKKRKPKKSINLKVLNGGRAN